MKLTLAFFALISLCSAQSLTCRGWNYCEMREKTTSATGRFEVQDLRNGSVTVRGENRSDVLVRMRVEAGAHSEREARNLFDRIHTNVAPGRFTVDGPDLENTFWSWFDTGYSVSVEVLVPQKTDLVLNTRNGAIRVADTTGNVQFDTRNGSATLTRVGGSVRGESRNGAIQVELSGASFESRHLSLESRNGSVTVSVPRSFNAHVITQTRNGHLRSDFPVTVRGWVRRDNDDGDREFDLGSGGGTMRMTTRNGGIRLRQL